MLKVQGVTANYSTPRASVNAISGVNLTIQDSEILGIAGESGCGKSTLLKLMYGNLIAPLELVAGSVTLEATSESGTPIVLRDRQIHQGWWKHISYIPQGAMSVLNPVSRIEPQFLDVVPRSLRLSKGALRARLVDYLGELGLPSSVLQAYPHQLSGGMRQRVIVAMATFLHPHIVLADEPTTALDVVVQKSILLMLRQLQQRMSNALVIVSHDMGVHYQVTHRLAVMYAGRLVELGPTRRVFDRPLHPYTNALIASLPRIGDRTKREGLASGPQEMTRHGTGCRFFSRCPAARPVCKDTPPPMIEVEPDHLVECHLFG